MNYIEPISKQEFTTLYHKAAGLDYGLLMLSVQGNLVATDYDNLKYVIDTVWYSQVIGIAIDPEDGKKYTVAETGYQGSSLEELYLGYTEYVVHNNEQIEEIPALIKPDRQSNITFNGNNCLDKQKIIKSIPI